MNRCSLTLYLPLLIGLFSLQANCATPTAPHTTMSKLLENGIEWATHLKDETKKGRKLSIKEIDGDVSGIASFLSTMDTAASDIIGESPSEKKEGHFIEMRRFQDAANIAVKEFISARQEPRPNYSKM